MRCLSWSQCPKTNDRRAYEYTACCHAIQHRRAAGHASLPASLLPLRLGAAAAGLAVLLHLGAGPAKAEEDLTIRFLASPNPELRTVQRSLVEAWGYVKAQFLDPTFNGNDWNAVLQESVDATFKAGSPDKAYGVLEAMLRKLGDPYTRVLRPRQSAIFRDTTEGQIMGLGLMVAPDPARPSAARVAFIAEGSPADEGGVHLGDELLQLNGKPVDAQAKQELAMELRLEADLLLRRTEGGNAGDVALHLVPGPIEVHPVQWALLPGASPVGYLRITVFSNNAARDVEAALQALQQGGAEALLLDLRDNSGGVVGAGYNIAQLLLQEGQRFCFVQDPSGGEEEVLIQDAHPTMQLQHMAVLVNGGTASTSELLAGALREDAQAVLIGEKTFGKGMTQRVITLSDGSTLLLSNRSYTLPNRQKVSGVGLQPTSICKPQDVVQQFWVSGGTDASSLSDDPCVQFAKEQLQGGLKTS